MCQLRHKTYFCCHKAVNSKKKKGLLNTIYFTSKRPKFLCATNKRKTTKGKKSDDVKLKQYGVRAVTLGDI